jgi:hypothetical protein
MVTARHFNGVSRYQHLSAKASKPVVSVGREAFAYQCVGQGKKVPKFFLSPFRDKPSPEQMDQIFVDKDEALQEKVQPQSVSRGGAVPGLRQGFSQYSD